MLRKKSARENKPRDASKLRLGIAVSCFNGDITEDMLLDARSVLRSWKVPNRNIHIVRTYGSFELPLACKRLIQKYRLHAVIALGCIVKGETRHDEYLAHAVTNGLMRLSLDTGVPVGLGVITVNTVAQARVRSRGKANHGGRATVAALDLALSLK